MVGILVVSYGGLARTLISSVRRLGGNVKKMSYISIWPRDIEERVRKRIRRRLAELEEGDGVLVLTDILGGTPANISLSLLANYRMQVVTGVNVPMLLTLSSYRMGRSLEEIGRLVKKSGRRSIILARDFLAWNGVIRTKGGQEG
jgi:PTS system mannose-specific IIA component